MRTFVKIAIVCIFTLGVGAFYLYSRGTIDPDEVYTNVLGLDQDSVFDLLGSPRRLDEITQITNLAFWQGREGGGWIYEIWFENDIAVEASISTNAFDPSIKLLKDSIGMGRDWCTGNIIRHEHREFDAWLTQDGNITIYDVGGIIVLATARSIFWERGSGDIVC